MSRSSSAAARIDLAGSGSTRVAFPSVLHADTLAGGTTAPPTGALSSHQQQRRPTGASHHNHHPGDAAGGDGDPSRRGQLLMELGNFIESRLQQRHPAGSSGQQSRARESDYEPILHRGFGSSAAAPSRREAPTLSTTTAAGEVPGNGRGPSPLDTFCSRDPAGPQQQQPPRADGNAGGSGSSGVEAVQHLHRALLAPDLTPVEQRHADPAASSSSARRGHPYEAQPDDAEQPAIRTRSPSPQDPSKQLDTSATPRPPPPPAQQQQQQQQRVPRQRPGVRTPPPPEDTVEAPQPVLSPRPTAAPQAPQATDADGTAPPSQPGSRLLDEIFALRRENATLRSQVAAQHREAEVLAAAVGRLEADNADQAEAVDTLEVTVTELRSQRDLAVADAAAASEELQAANDLYEALLQRHEELMREAAATEQGLKDQLDSLRGDLNGALDAGQAEASMNQKLIDVMTAELGVLRERVRSYEAAAGDAPVTNGTGGAPADVAGSRPRSPAVEVCEEEPASQQRQSTPPTTSEGAEAVIECSPIPPAAVVQDASAGDIVLAAVEEPRGGRTNEESTSLAPPPQHRGGSVPTNSGERTNSDVTPEPEVQVMLQGSAVQAPGSPTITVQAFDHVQPPVAISPGVAGGVPMEAGSSLRMVTSFSGSVGSCFSPQSMLGNGSFAAPGTTNRHIQTDFVATTATAVTADIGVIVGVAAGTGDGGVDPADFADITAMFTPERPQREDATVGGDTGDRSTKVELALLNASRQNTDLQQRLDEATGQWTKWVEQCNKAKVVLLAERQAREAADRHATELQSEIEELIQRVDELTAAKDAAVTRATDAEARATAAESTPADLYTASDLREAVLRARDEGLTLATDVAEYCMRVLDDVKSGKRVL